MLRSLISGLQRFTVNEYVCPRLVANFCTATDIQDKPEKELDALYKRIFVEVRGHDRAVLNSYETFTKLAAYELGVCIANIAEPRQHHERKTLLKSAFVHKKHRVQYEMRTYFRIFELKHLTGSTADTFLEYIQRNLPEGVSMKVTMHRIEKIPDSILKLRPANQIEQKDSAQAEAVK